MEYEINCTFKDDSQLKTLHTTDSRVIDVGDGMRLIYHKEGEFYFNPSQIVTLFITKVENKP